MLTDENFRFMELVEVLRKQGVIADYVQLSQILETNKAGISDIKAGRKKISIDLLRRMKLSYPQINIEWIIMGVGDMLIGSTPASNEQVTTLKAQNELLREQLADAQNEIKEQAKELGKCEEHVQTIQQLRADLEHAQNTIEQLTAAKNAATHSHAPTTVPAAP
ncbi:MAG: transcriptional regulator [Prevotella sp.]|nr:transcriptional regulator [Bacteroides sp.]MCM1446605.1 transcriptional regulator [Prevotella sp.]